MLELPQKFKSALGNGIRTSLFPVIRFYKDVRLDEPDTWSEAESVNLSIKDTNLDGIAFDPLLLNAPNINSSADIINNKYTISSVSLSISNAPYRGKIFSDDIQSLLNSVCQIYYCANGLDSLEDCLLVYTGTVRRFNQSAESIKLTLEDITEQMLSTEIPSSIVPDEPLYREEDKGKPYPMVYGYVDKSPLITQFTGLNESGQLENKIGEFHIDKKGRAISGMWDSQIENWGHELNQSHRLYTEGYLNNTKAYLSVHNENFSPIFIELSDDWGFGDYEVPINNKIYNFKQTNGSDTSASVIVNSDALINLESIYGLPTRFYRPIESIECFTYCDNVQGTNSPAINRIYGFTGFSSGGSGYFEPYDKNNIFNSDAYDYNWSSDDRTWWQPTACNDNNNGGVYTSIDKKWINEGRDGSFPVDRIQNGLTGDGLYLCGRNPDGERPQHNKSGGAYIRLKLKENVGDYNCITKIIYDAEYHSFAGMTTSDNKKNPYPAQFWTNNFLVILDDNLDIEDITDAENLKNELEFPYLPNNEFSDIDYDSHDNNEKSVFISNGEGISNTFNKTTQFNSVQFGIPQYPKLGTTAGNDNGYVSAQLYNAWILQDAVISDPLNETFYLDVAGRIAWSVFQTVISNPINVYRIEVLQDDLGEKTFILSLGSYEGDNSAEGQYLDQFINDNPVELNVVIQYGSIWDGEYINWRFPYNDGSGIYKIQLFELPLHIKNAIEYGDYGPLEVEFRMVEPFALQPFTKADEIMFDILDQELNYQGPAQLSNTDENWQYSFTLTEKQLAKDVFEGLFKSSTIIPIFDEKGQFNFIENKQLIKSYNDVNLINIDDIIKYSYKLTKIDEIYNQVNVKYRKNYATGEFDKETSYKLIDGDYNEYENLDKLTEYMYVGLPENHYTTEYYGLKNIETKFEVETDYIRDEVTARKLQKKLVCWYANQHLITNIDLPVNYMDLEVGDYIRFDELLGGKLAFGYDYTKPENRNGQLVYPVFFITKINKSLQKISIEAIQIHRGEYGFPDQDLITDENHLDGGGNDGQGNFDLGDPNDNPDYNQDTIIEEDFEEDLQIEPYFDSSWLNQQNNITQNPITAIVSTNIEQDWDYDISISQVYTSTGEGITYENHSGEQITIPDGIYNEENAPSAMDLVNHIKSTSDIEDNYNGQVLISKKFVFEMDEYPEEVQVDFIIKIYNDNNVKYLEFNQKGEYTGVDILGDVNGDFVVNILDVVMIMGAILNHTEDELENADMNGDGIVNVQDLVALVNEILGQ